MIRRIKGKITEWPEVIVTFWINNKVLNRRVWLILLVFKWGNGEVVIVLKKTDDNLLFEGNIARLFCDV